MRTSPHGTTLIKRYEALRTLAYQDSGEVWTIGYGHTAGVEEGDTCTGEQALLWLQEDLTWAEKEVEARVTVPLSQSMFDALVSFVFNLGPKAFQGSTLLRALNSGNYHDVPGQLLRWYHTKGSEWGLLRRRAAEAALFLEDQRP
jgi:lysozyme